MRAALIAALLICLVRGSVGLELPSKVSAQPNTQVIPVEIEDPHQYFYGNILTNEVFKYKRDIFTAVQVHPYMSSGMYDGQLTFCKDVGVQFEDITEADLVVIVYGKQYSPKLCYMLVSVSVVHR
jgi:hypothetical protein